MINPFYLTGIIPGKYFCDREKETNTITSLLENQGNVLLTSARKMGKTQIIRHVFDQDEIKDNYYTFYVDIYSATSLREMVFFLGKEIYQRLVPKGKRALSRFLGAVKSITTAFSLDPVSGNPRINLQLGDITTPELTLEEIFDYLEAADKPCLFAIDEFQQIARFPEKNIEALLRTHIQKMNNCHFIFSGSDRHILEQMFSSYSKPFYNSAQPLFLDRIPKEKYVGFVIGCFAESGREIDPDAVSYCYDLFDGYTFYMHKVFHDLFARDTEARLIGKDLVSETVDAILGEGEHGYREQMASLSTIQKQVLVAIAKEGTVSQPTSGGFIKRNSLPSSSSVQKAMISLMESQYVTYQMIDSKRSYLMTDKFLELWLRLIY